MAGILLELMTPAGNGVSITSTAETTRCRGVWIGTTQSLDFCFISGTWVTFQGCTAGTMVPVRAIAVRKTAAAAACSAGDVVFLYTGTINP